MQTTKYSILIIHIVNYLEINNGWIWQAQQTSSWWLYTPRIRGMTTSRNASWIQFNEFYFSKPSDKIVPAITNITNCDCPRIYMPICAMDGRSYTNICWMNCKNWSRVEEYELGPNLTWWDPNDNSSDMKNVALKEWSPHQTQIYHKGHCTSLLDPYYENVWKGEDPDYLPEEELRQIYDKLS